MFVLTVILGLGLTGAYLMVGSGKIAKQPMMEESKTRLGVDPEMWTNIGRLELAGATGVLLGLFGPLAIIGVLAGIGIILLMLGAIYYHQKVGDDPKATMPAVVMLVAAVLYVIFRVASA